MNSCEEFEGLIAQAAYEELPEGDEMLLRQHLDTCESCAAESRALVALKAFVPVESVVFQGNLRPVMEERVRETRSVSWIPRPLLFGICSGILFGIVAVSFVRYYLDQSSGPAEYQFATNDAFDPVRDRVHKLLEEEEYARAYVSLDDAIGRVEATSVPADAQQLLADIAFEHLKWYPEAYTAYDQFRLNHSAEYQGSDESIRRYALLDEAQALDSDYASLHTWESVLLEEDVEALAGYIQKYPGTFQASDAVQEMARLISTDNEDVNLDSVLEVAIASSDNAVVVAQIKLELGRYYWQEGDDSEKARILFEELEDSPVTVLAQAASQSLRALQSQ